MVFSQAILRSFSVVVLFTGTACAWVEPHQGSAQIELKTLDQVSSCQRIGVATAQTKAKVSFYRRDQDKVAAEVLALAKNEATKLSGDSLVSLGSIEDGRQQFAVYRCRN